MKVWKTLILFGCVVGGLYSFLPKKDLPYPPFDASMAKANADFSDLYQSKFGKQWTIVKGLYEKYAAAKPSLKPRIPKIIHQIWLGGPLPAKYEPLQKTWKEKHPDWEYRLWTDTDVLQFPFRNRQRFEQAINIGEKADILRYEILHLQGGVYVDMDFECMRPLDPLNHTLDFYVGLLGAYTTTQETEIGNAFIGSIPRHPILKYCLDQIAKKAPGKTADEVQAVSGPGCIRRAFFKCYREKHLRNVAFPFTFFYPLPPHERCGHLKEEILAKWVEPETFGIHYWDVSWAKF